MCLDVKMQSHRRLAFLDAPSNLGLKPPAPGREPGVRYSQQFSASTDY
jgi:hypothetical protein